MDNGCNEPDVKIKAGDFNDTFVQIEACCKRGCALKSGVYFFVKASK